MLLGCSVDCKRHNGTQIHESEQKWYREDHEWEPPTSDHRLSNIDNLGGQWKTLSIKTISRAGGTCAGVGSSDYSGEEAKKVYGLGVARSKSSLYWLFKTHFKISYRAVGSYR